MTAILILVFAVLAAAAIGFAVWPLFIGSRFIGSRGPGADAPNSKAAREARTTENRKDTFPGRRSRTARLLLGCALALFMLGIGGGAYWILGEPALALRSLQGSKTRDLNGLIGLLAARVRGTPDSLTGWTLLGRGYLTAGDPHDAALAFARAIALHPSSGLYSAYGEALVEESSGAVNDEAEAAFKSALAADPKDAAARYYLGLAAAARGDGDAARALWQGLLADLPAASPLRQILVDRIAMLASRSGEAPDIAAMVAGLAARLKTAPDDAPGWQRLVRAYSVLGDTARAKAALADARKALAKEPAALAALDGEAKELKLDN